MVLPTASAASSIVRHVSAPAAAAGERSVPGSSPDGNDGDSSGGTIEAKSSSNYVFGHVRLGIVKRWIQTVFARAQRHQKLGKTKFLQAAAVAKSLLSNNTWVKRLRVAANPVDKGVLSRVIGMAVTLLNEANAIKLENTCGAEDRFAQQTEELVDHKHKAWRISLAEAREILELTSDTQPLVGGVRRSAPPFGRSPPDDAPPAAPSGTVPDMAIPRLGSVAAGSEAPSPTHLPTAARLQPDEEEAKSVGSAAREDAIGSIGGGRAGGGIVAAEPSPVVNLVRGHDDGGRGSNSEESSASIFPLAASGAPTGATTRAPIFHLDSGAGGAGGRSKRAAQADAVMDAASPCGGDLMRSPAVSLADSSRRFDKKQRKKRLAAAAAERTRRIEVLAALLDKHPDNPAFQDILLRAMEPASGAQ